MASMVVLALSVRKKMFFYPIWRVFLKHSARM